MARTNKTKPIIRAKLEKINQWRNAGVLWSDIAKRLGVNIDVINRAKRKYLKNKGREDWVIEE